MLLRWGDRWGSWERGGEREGGGGCVTVGGPCKQEERGLKKVPKAVGLVGLQSFLTCWVLLLIIQVYYKWTLLGPGSSAGRQTAEPVKGCLLDHGVRGWWRSFQRPAAEKNAGPVQIKEGLRFRLQGFGLFFFGLGV